MPGAAFLKFVPEGMRFPIALLRARSAMGRVGRGPGSGTSLRWLAPPASPSLASFALGRGFDLIGYEFVRNRSSRRSLE
jgi:hypothetical protein